MNIGLIGRGRMGKLTAEAAEKSGHSVIKQFDSEDRLIATDQLENTECLIDFSTPETVSTTISIAVEAKVNIVIGTTGWDKDILNGISEKLDSALFVASNFSIGINLFRLIIKNSTKLLDGIGGYDISVKEIHHIKKLDSPSGTALTISEDIISQSSSKRSIHAGPPTESISGDTLRITSERINDVVGVHEVLFESGVDTISLRHEMKDRNAFAVGAIAIAEWLKGRAGILNFNDYIADVYGISIKV